MSKIRIEVDNLRSSSNKLKLQLEKIKNVQERMRSLVAEIDSSWDGDASRAYIERLNGYVKKIDQTINLIKVFDKYITDTADRFEETDNEWDDNIKKIIPNLDKILTGEVKVNASV